MSVHVMCPTCGRASTISADFARRRLVCPECKRPFAAADNRVDALPNDDRMTFRELVAGLRILFFGRSTIKVLVVCLCGLAGIVLSQRPAVLVCDVRGGERVKWGGMATPVAPPGSPPRPKPVEVYSISPSSLGVWVFGWEIEQVSYKQDGAHYRAAAWRLSFGFFGLLAGVLGGRRLGQACFPDAPANARLAVPTPHTGEAE